MVITHNMVASNTKRQLNINSKRKSKLTEKLSSGYKINRAADDAAGLSISEKMRGQIRGLNQASRNIQDGISLIQVAEGALNEDHDILQRMNELAVQAANDTNTDADRSAIQKEINQLVSELNRIADSTEFNAEIHPLKREIPQSWLLVTDTPKISADEIGSMTKQTIDLSNITNGSYSGYSINDNTITITGEENYVFQGSFSGNNGKIVINSNAVITAPDDCEMNMDITVKGGKNVAILTSPYTKEGLGHSVKAGKLELEEGSTLTIKYDPTKYQIPSTGIEFDSINMQIDSTLNLEGVTVQCFSDMSVIGNVEGATGTSINIYYDMDNHSHSKLLGRKIDVDNLTISSGTLSLSGAGDPVSANTDIRIKDGSWQMTSISGSDAYMLRAEYDIENNDEENEIWIQAGANSEQGILIDKVDASAVSLGIDYLSVMSHEKASRAIETIHGAIEKVSSYRSYFGAIQNRLEHAMAIDDSTAENLQNSESKIRDTDIAKEMVELAKMNILDQVGVSMLSQANQSNQGILGLLR